MSKYQPQPLLLDCVSKSSIISACPVTLPTGEVIMQINTYHESIKLTREQCMKFFNLVPAQAETTVNPVLADAVFDAFQDKVSNRG